MTQRSPLHEFTTRLGASFTDFGGWSMPLEFESVIAEHMTVRERCGWFDVSHLGRFAISGPSAAEVLDAQSTMRGSSLEPGRTKYGLILNESGGIVDDIVVWRLDQERFVVLPNAANAAAVMHRFARADPRDLVPDTAMVAVQGPEAPGVIEGITGSAPARFRVGETERGWIQAGTGYTGERGGELIVPRSDLAALIERLEHSGAAPCGLGARDTLRLEAGLPLWGQDMDATVDPYRAGLGFAVDLDHDFVGRDALDPEVSSARVRFTTASRRVPRAGQKLLDGEGNEVGEVTSGTFSPVRSEGIGMAYLESKPDSLFVDIRGRAVPIEIVPGAFI